MALCGESFREKGQGLKFGELGSVWNWRGPQPATHLYCHTPVLRHTCTVEVVGLLLTMKRGALRTVTDPSVSEVDVAASSEKVRV